MVMINMDQVHMLLEDKDRLMYMVLRAIMAQVKVMEDKDMHHLKVKEQETIRIVVMVLVEVVLVMIIQVSSLNHHIFNN